MAYDRWSAAELEVIGAHPDLTSLALAGLLPGRTPQAVGNIRSRHFGHRGNARCAVPPARAPGDYVETVAGYLADDWECLAIWCKWNGYDGCRELSRDERGWATLLCTTK